MQSNNESTFTRIGSDTHNKEYPPKLFVTFCKASVGRHDIAYYKEDRIVEKIGPGMRSMKEASQTDPHEDQWYQEQEYTTPTIAPLRQPCDQLPTCFGFEIEQQRQYQERHDKEKLKKPQMSAPEVDEIGRIKGKSKGTPVERRNQLPDGVNSSSMGNKLKVKLGWQQDKRTNCVQRDEEPLDPLKKILPAAPEF